MSANCLVTRLKAIVADSNLSKLGEFRFLVNAVDTPAGSNRGFTVVFYKDVEISVSGEGAYFTDSTFNDNLGTTLTVLAGVSTDVYVSNVDAVVSIADKYSLRRFSAYGSSWDRGNFVFNVDELKYSPIEYFLWQGCTGLYGNIDNVCGNGVIVQANIQNNNNLTGNIENWSNTLRVVRITSKEVVGSVENAPMLNDIETLIIGSPKITGSLAALSPLTHLVTFSLAETVLSGDIGQMSFYESTNLQSSATFNATVTGAIEDFADNLYAAGNRKSAINLATTDNMTYNGVPAKTNYGKTAHINLSGGAPVITF